MGAGDTMLSDELIFNIFKNLGLAKEISKTLRGADKSEGTKIGALTILLQKAEEEISSNISYETYQRLVLMDKDSNATWKANNYHWMKKRMEQATDPAEKQKWKEFLEKYYPSR